jgi:type VI secretion system protein ImpI
MTLTLTIENETKLPDGGPLSVTIQGKRGIDIGRDSHLDWTLPDPTRFISGKHCEVRFRDGGYWLHDVSTNGTFLYGADHRMQAPHRLRHGDRFVVGNYIVVVAVAGEDGAADSADAAASAPRAVDYQALWSDEGAVVPPIAARDLRAPQRRAPAQPDFLDWAADVPDPVRAPMPPASRPAQQPPAPPAPNRDVDRDMDWAVGPPSRVPATPPPTPPIPVPRRPTAQTPTPSFWDDGAPPQDAPAPPAIEQAAPRDNVASVRPAAPMAGGTGSPDAFLRQLAAAAGVPDDVFARLDPDTLAQQLGGVLRIVVDDLMQLLSARAQSKQLARSSNHTVVQAVDNNPLKFAPSAQDALRIMFGPPTRSYLDAQHAVAQSFADLKQHQIKTYAAMQHALSMLMADLGPHAIEGGTQDAAGVAGLLTSRKARLWDTYVARWQAKVREDERGPIDAFMLHFSEYYDREVAQPPQRAQQPSSQSRTGTAEDNVLA